MPNSFAETPDGLLMIADGFSAPLVWDSFAAQAKKAGVPKPTSAVTISDGSVPGGIVGTYRSFVRFLDKNGLVSDLSPVSNELVAMTTTGIVTGARDLSPIVITSVAHGLTNAARVRIEGATGNTGANGIFDITVTSPDHFTLEDSTTSGAYLGGATWTAGADSVIYVTVPTTDDPRVVRRQILRNTDGQFNTFYVDVDTTDMTSQSFISTNTDADLQAGTVVAVLDPVTSEDLANLHAEPPNSKKYLINVLGRMFGAGWVVYTEGAVKLLFGSRTVVGIGTEWTEAVFGRFMYVVGGNAPYEIETVNVATQTITLNLPYTGPDNPYAAYAITPPAAEEDLINFSEALLPESWPAVNAMPLPADGDYFTGLMAHRSMLYILKARHIYRLTFGEDPPVDGDIFLNSSRGCINNRCWCIVEGSAYMLDDQGVHVFLKQERDNPSISLPIQTLFNSDAPGPKINWAASQFFHCVPDTATETIRWFVALTGQYLPRHALAYHYTLDRWWIEEYHVPIGSSVVGKLSRQAGLSTWGVGRDQVFLGSQHRQVLAWSAGRLDGYHDGRAGSRQTVVSATRRTLTGSESLDSTAVGSPVAIVSGRGQGQVRLVTAASGATITVKRPWIIQPDTTSVFQVGGIVWSYKTGWLRWVQEETQNPRRIELNFEPTPGQSLDLTHYRDRLADPIDMAVTRDDDGVAMTTGEAVMRVDLDRASGFAQARLDGGRELSTHGPRQISVGLAGVGGIKPVRVYELTVDGATQ